MQLICSSCASHINIPDTVRFFTCAACNNSQKVLETENAFYTESISIDSEAFAKAHIRAAQAQKQDKILTAIYKLEEAWKLQETSFMDNGKLRFDDKNAEGAARIFTIIALAITIFAISFSFLYMRQSLFSPENISSFSVAALVIFWTLAIWQGLVNSEKKFAYRDAKAEFDLKRKELQFILQKLQQEMEALK